MTEIPHGCVFTHTPCKFTLMLQKNRHDRLGGNTGENLEEEPFER